ncbi:MAG: rRNA maturation RNase YbeY [Chloroflexi bacterium]|nr:rRNA maturation RNase YbeY [Chloroflexota bacterium]
MAEHVIPINIAQPFVKAVSDERLAAIALRVLEAEDVPPCELSVTVTDDETVRGLNRKYAGEDAVTDVLSFSQREGESFVAAPGSVPPLGDVVIAYPQALRQAQDRLPRQAEDPSTSSGRADWSVEKEIERLLIHGTLHLLGYDHAEAEEERRMRAREEELLGAIG